MSGIKKDDDDKKSREHADLLNNSSVDNGSNNGIPQTSRLQSQAVGLCTLIAAHVQYYYKFHRVEFVLACILILSVSLAMSGLLAGGSGKIRPIGNFELGDAENDVEMLATTSQYDHVIGKIDHWCLMGDDNSCNCDDPLLPSPRAEKGWAAARNKNLKLISEVDSSGNIWGDNPEYDYLATQFGYDDEAGVDKETEDDGTTTSNDITDDYVYEDDDMVGLDYFADLIPEDPDLTLVDGTDMDVVFLGDSITEHRNGRSMGEENSLYNDIKEVFDKQFHKSEGGNVEGLALGIAGDTAPNLLWRILHGEMPEDFKPKVYWVHIGINDLRSMLCSEEVVLLGILRVVEEILKRQSEATVVINSILPTTDDKNGFLADSDRTTKVSALRHKGRVDLWPSISWINMHLRMFVKKNNSEKVKFFDADPVFTEEKNGKTFMNMKLFMDDRLHPNSSGHEKWGKAIIDTLQKIPNET